PRGSAGRGRVARDAAAHRVVWCRRRPCCRRHDRASAPEAGRGRCVGAHGAAPRLPPRDRGPEHDLNSLAVSLRGMKLRIDEDVCPGHGRCYALIPALVDADEYGHGMVIVDEVPDELVAQARLAQTNCPENAITLEE